MIKINQDIFYKLVKERSFSNSKLEVNMAEAIYKILKEFKYFQENETFCGIETIKNDFLGRKIPWALYKSNCKTKKTIVFLGHFDTVSNVNFNDLKDYATDPDTLKAQLKKLELSKEVKDDLESDEWIFGRGTADMKGGLSILLNVLNEISTENKYSNNILFITVPDEETFSKGMREAVSFLSKLKEEHDLDYELVINGESHVKTNNQSCYYDGTIGKTMLNLIVRGVQSHVRYYFEGLNPILLASNIVSNIDGNIDLADESLGESTPPPCCVRLRDTKEIYDVTLPQSVEISLSYLMLKKSPLEIMEEVKVVTKESIIKMENYLEKHYKNYSTKQNRNVERLGKKIRVLDFNELLQYAETVEGIKFKTYYKEMKAALEKDIQESKVSIANATSTLINRVLNYINPEFPIVVIALSPPLYPGFTNLDIRQKNNKVHSLKEGIVEFCQNELGKDVCFNSYFSGISDMSYLATIYDDDVIDSIANNMPLWGNSYNIDFNSIKKIQAPVFNIGPWGKDIHKMTERVNKKDLFIECKQIIEYIIKNI